VGRTNNYAHINDVRNISYTGSNIDQNQKLLYGKRNVNGNWTGPLPNFQQTLKNPMLTESTFPINYGFIADTDRLNLL